MTDTECLYAQIKKEALATTWACEKFTDCVVGKKILIETDHKPLVPLLTKDGELTSQNPLFSSGIVQI